MNIRKGRRSCGCRRRVRMQALLQLRCRQTTAPQHLPLLRRRRSNSGKVRVGVALQGKRRRGTVVGLVALLALTGLPASGAGKRLPPGPLGAGDLAVIINTADQLSVAIGEYYVAARNI